jgi:putative PIN family toxin of toxin-antitoxin system
VIVVVDSGIWISAIEFGGTPAVALERMFLIDDLAICSDIEEEVLRVLHDKFGRDRKLIQQRLGPLLSQAVHVTVTGEIAGVCRDPNDDCILECAVKADAQLIIAGDKDLLALGAYRGIRIVTARQYLDEIDTTTH